MAVFLYVSLVFLPLTAEVYSNRNVVGKYGCVFSPNVCVPPEDCNGITGHCQISSRGTGRDYRDEDRDVSRLLEAVRSYDYKDSPPHESDTGFSLDTDTNSLEALVKTSQGSFPHISHSVNANYEVEGRQQRTKHETRQLINKHLDEFQYALAQRGRKLADLTTDELRVIVKYLANVIRNEQSQNSDDSYQYGGSEQGPESNLKPKDYGGIPQHSMHTSEDIDTSPIQALPITLEHEDPSDKDSIEETGNIPRDGIEMEVAESANTKSSNLDTTSDPTAQSTIQKETLYIVIIVVGATVLLIIVVSITSCAYYTYRKKKQEDIKFMQSMTSRQPVGSEYQDLCRQHYANKNCEAEDGSDSDGNFQEYSVSSARFADHEHKGYEPIRNSSVSSMSWSEEPATASLDIATGHKVLDYMENHLNNKDRLAQEWQDLCKSKPDEFTVEVAKSPLNISKNRIDAALPYDYNRVKLNAAENHIGSDYINASKVIDSDPKRPLYIAAQGPLLSTVSDFWQMVWEHDCVAIVMLTALVEDGMSQCARYWPDEGSSKYHNFEINLVSEHIWCEHYLVRSLYVKHLVTRETRTITQFHFLSWPKNSIPSTPKHLLELRRKVSKCSKAHHSPVLVHCSDGVGRTGTYILLDLAINRLLKKPLEIDIAATLEHIRDMRAGMVANKDQFEFALTAVAEEVNAAINTTKARAQMH